MLRSYRVEKVIALKRKLREKLKGYVGAKMHGDNYRLFLDDVFKMMPKSVQKYGDNVEGSVEGVAGQVMTDQVLDVTVWRIAGNLSRLSRKEDGVVPAWTGQRRAEWVPAQVLSASRCRNGTGKVGYAFTFLVMAGTPAGLRMTKFWSDQFCRFAARSFGFNTRPPPRHGDKPARGQFRHPTELVGMRLTAFVEPRLSTPSSPGFEKMRFGAADLTWNREQLKYRDRLLPAYACPHKVPDAVPCFRCPHGAKSCRAGTHPADYVIKACATCKREKAPFEAGGDDRCVECKNRKAMATN